MKLIRNATLVVLGLGIALFIFGWLAWSPKAPTYAFTPENRARALTVRLRSPEEHDHVRAEQGEPYVLELALDEGALLYFGGYHSEDPEDPQLSEIRTRWDEFEPTVALCEGRQRGYLLGPLFPRLVGLSEAALVHELAGRDGVTLFSLEPDYETEVAQLLQQFEPADVALFFTLRVYWSESGGVANEPLAEDLRSKRTDVDGLREALPNLAAMDATWTNSSAEGDWRTWSNGSVGRLLEIDLASRRVRGEHMAQILIELVERRERVFAVVGSGHVIRQEWTLRAALGAEPAGDEPIE